MKFPHKSILTRNNLDIIPYFSVFLLLLIFISFHTSFIVVPGLPVSLKQIQSIQKITPGSKLLTITADGKFVYDKKSMTEKDFYDYLNNELKSQKAPTTLILKTEQGVQTSLIQKIVNFASENKIAIEFANDYPDLPAAEIDDGATGSITFAVVDINGQLYYENQAVNDTQFKARLASAVKKSQEPLTLVLLADKSVSYDVIIRLGTIARSAGIERVLLATRPPTLPVITK